MSDLFCTLATGISYGGRRLYSDDDENVFTVERPAAFNGIPGDLVERADLASRLIKIFVPPLMRRRTEAMLGAEFQAIWPGVFGALLDGLVAGLRDGRGIAVADPARLMDFEQFAEAGCRRMGFQQWEFVDAYAVNRKGGLITVAEGHPVARAITAYMEKHPDGFVGRMSALFTKLGWFKVALKIADRDCLYVHNVHDVGEVFKPTSLATASAEYPETDTPNRSRVECKKVLPASWSVLPKSGSSETVV